MLGLRSAKQNEGMKEMLNRALVVVIIESVTHHTAVSAEPSLQQGPAPTLTGLLGKYLNICSAWRRSVARRPGTGTVRAQHTSNIFYCVDIPDLFLLES